MSKIVGFSAGANGSQQQQLLHSYIGGGSFIAAEHALRWDPGW
jgi:hypothetical protein